MGLLDSRSPTTYLCGLGHALAKDFNLDIADIGVQRDGHVVLLPMLRCAFGDGSSLVASV